MGPPRFIFSMPRRRVVKPGSIFNNDRGQALTEMAIIIPVVLLTFLAMVQQFDIIRSAQLGNYAAYVAARSYAVHHAQDKENKAQTLAFSAASMALAPISHLAPGELAGFGGRVTPDRTSYIALLEGYFMASRIRLNPKAAGGSLEVKRKDG